MLLTAFSSLWWTALAHRIAHAASPSPPPAVARTSEAGKEAEKAQEDAQEDAEEAVTTDGSSFVALASHADSPAMRRRRTQHVTIASYAALTQLCVGYLLLVLCFFDPEAFGLSCELKMGASARYAYSVTPEQLLLWTVGYFVGY